MIQTKYFFIVGIILVCLILYYFYDELSNVKKSFVPLYQKTMALEAKMADLDKPVTKIAAKQPVVNHTKSEENNVFSITYDTDMTKNVKQSNEDLTLRYANLSDRGVDNLIKKSKPKTLDDELSEFKEFFNTPKSNSRFSAQSETPRMPKNRSSPNTRRVLSDTQQRILPYRSVASDVIDVDISIIAPSPSIMEMIKESSCEKIFADLPSDVEGIIASIESDASSPDDTMDKGAKSTDKKFNRYDYTTTEISPKMKSKPISPKVQSKPASPKMQSKSSPKAENPKVSKITTRSSESTLQKKIGGSTKKKSNLPL